MMLVVCFIMCLRACGVIWLVGKLVGWPETLPMQFYAIVKAWRPDEAIGARGLYCIVALRFSN